MKNRIRFAITLASAVLCALPNLAMAQSGSSNSQGEDQGAAIEGTWITTVHVAPGVSFTALTSFTAGGVILATGTFDRKPPFAPAPTALISPLYGTWTRVDNKTYHASLNFFTFDILGNAVNMIRNNQTYTVSNDGNGGYSGDGGLASSASFSGPATLTVDGGGNIYVADPGNNAIRILQPVAHSMMNTVKVLRRER